MKVYAGTNADGSPKLEDGSAPRPCGELMTHTAGFSYGSSAITGRQ